MNIRNIILDQYQFDIDEINLIKLYKIESSDIAENELEKKLTATRKRWIQGANSPNEMIASRDKARLAQADMFEEVLRNRRYLKALVAYYTNGGGTEQAASEFAREFFTTLKDVNKSISQKDFNFFMQYFREERKNERAILEMLKKEFHAVTLKNASQEDEEEQSESGMHSVIAQTRFHKDSICLLHRIETKFASLQKSTFLQRKYPELNQSLYDFVGVETRDETEFRMYLDGAVQMVFSARQNDAANSDEYIPLSEFFNDWKDLLKRPDVTENFYDFKKLIRYPKLTPYFYLAENVDIAFLEMMLKKVRNEYDFGSLDDFLYIYFKPLADGRHYSFIIDKKLENLLKKTETDPEKVAQDAKRRSASAKRRKMIPISLRILRILATWPIYLVQFLFELFRFTVVNVQDLIWVVMIFSTVLLSHGFHNMSVFEALADMVLNFGDMVGNIVYAAARTYVFNNFSFILGALFLLVQFMFKFLLAPAVMTGFLYFLAQELDRGIDLMGFHKTFQNIQQTIDQQVLYYYKKKGEQLYKKMVPPIVANILTAVVFLLLVLIIASLISFFG